MKLLYDISATDSSELHETLGFVDSDLDMLQLAQYIRSATRELVGYIGEENYKIATDFYEEEKYTEEFLILCKYAIGLNAWRKFAPLLDVSHTSQGRAFRADDQLKPAFEHQITNSDKAMEKNYYQAINEIFDAALSVGGTLSGEHGIGLTKRPYLKKALGEAGVNTLKLVKQALDPKGILNPGKIWE